MALTRQQKEESVKYVQQNMAAATSVVIVAYDGLTVGEINELRANLHAAGGALRVIPKKLLKIALSGITSQFDPTVQEGQLAVAWGDDAVAPAKTLSDFAEKHSEKMSLLAGTLEGNELSLEEVSALAKLPTRQELLGQMAYVFAGPARGFVTVLSGVQRGFVTALKAIADQKE
jgi:large subunit ribosomal protein L10